MKRMIKRLLILLFILSLPVAGSGFLFLKYINTSVETQNPNLAVEKGMTLRQISTRLADQKIIQYPTLFIAFAKFSKKQVALQAGEYQFKMSNTPREVLGKLLRGDVIPLKVQLIEGWNLEQIADYLAGLPFIKDPNFREEMLALANDREFIQSLGLDVTSLEGYLFPDTYHLSPRLGLKDYMKIFVAEFKKNYEKILQGLKDSPTLSRHEIVTLASVIEKETGAREERPLIASVFHNRLARKIPLQSDPTIIYGLKNFDGNIRKEDLTNPHPYNTYVHPGLPPGPICSPGADSIRAVLEPAASDYLYFVSKNNGTHHFSKTYAEHASAVQKFQIRGEKEETD